MDLLCQQEAQASYGDLSVPADCRQESHGFDGSG